jgi:hypothetical protein
MSWDFSIEGGAQQVIIAELEKGLGGAWNIKEDSKKRLLDYYHTEGFDAVFFDDLTTCLCLELDLYICDVLKQLQLETLFDRRSKKANAAMNELFFDWNRNFKIYTPKTEYRVQTKDSSAFLKKEELIELVYWIEICCTLLAGETVWLVDPEKEAALLERAIQYCEPLKEREEMKALGFYLPMHQYLKEAIEESSFDLFYWYNSY